MRTLGNPLLNRKYFESQNLRRNSQDVATVNGTLNKCFASFVLLFISALIGWKFLVETPGLATLFLIIFSVLTFIFSLIIIFVKKTSRVLVPVYSVLEGFTLGVISAVVQISFEVQVINAVLLTAFISFLMFFVYRREIIKVTKKFRIALFCATLSIFFVYLFTFILGFFNVQIPYIHGSGDFGIIFSLVIIAIASFNLLIDFDNIYGLNKKYNLPKYFEWYFAFGLLITVVWMYIEILRLLIKLKQRD